MRFKTSRNNGFHLYQQNPLFCSLQDETLVQISRHVRNLEQSFHQYETDIKATLKDCDIKMHPALRP